MKFKEIKTLSVSMVCCPIWLWPHLIPSNIHGERGITVLGECTVELGTGALVCEDIVGELQHLPTANEGICAVAILRWLGYPRLKGPPNAIAKEVGLRAKYLSRVKVQRIISPNNEAYAGGERITVPPTL
jgi:hypothetical protein